MDVTIDRGELLDAVAWSARALPSRPHVPALLGIHLVAAGGDVAASAFDEASYARSTATADTSTAGQALVVGRLLLEIARAVPAGPVRLRTIDQRLVVTAGAATFRLPLLTAEDYPSAPHLAHPSGHVGGAQLAEAVAQTAVAVSNDPALHALTGIRLAVAGERLTLAATDRYRLAVRHLSWRPARVTDDTTLLIPGRVLADVSKALAGAAEVALGFDDPHGRGAALTITAGPKAFRVRLIDAAFPDYDKLLPDPTTAASEVNVDVATLQDAVKRMTLVASAKTSPVRLSAAGDTLRLELGAEDTHAQEEVALEHGPTDGEVSIAFNPHYLLDALGSLHSDQARIRVTSPTRPAVLTGKDDTAGCHLLMPVRTND